MGLVAQELVDCGLDWATFTAPTHRTGTMLASQSEKLLRSEEARGNILRPWSMKGYEGFKCGSIAAGVRHDSAIVRLGGSLAQAHWRDFYGLSENASRVDLQATYRFTEAAPAIVTSTYRGMLNHWRKKQHGPEPTFWKRARGGGTIYLGQRCSSRFGRIYDKGAQSKLAFYDRAVRYELELKGNLAWSVLSELARTTPQPKDFTLADPELASVNSWVTDYFIKAGVRTKFAGAQASLLRSAPANSDVQAQLTWLSKQVSPAIMRLCSLGHGQAVLQSLFQLGPDRAQSGPCQTIDEVRKIVYSESYDGDLDQGGRNGN